MGGKYTTIKAKKEAALMTILIGWLKAGYRRLTLQNPAGISGRVEGL